MECDHEADPRGVRGGGSAVGNLRRHFANRTTLLAILAVGLAYSVLVQLPDSNQNSHYALVKAIAGGTPTIDKTRHETGDLGTWDISVVDGHTYANKAPGLAFVSVPLYVALDALGARTTGDSRNMLWALHLWGVVVPAVILLFLVCAVAERVEPGLGPLTAASVGLGTLLFPFGTMFFSHLLATMLAFAAFALLIGRGDLSSARVFAAGILGGLAVVVEYPMALAVLIVGVYAVRRRPRVRRGLAYLLGVALGMVPLLAYHQWAFGSVTTLSYSSAVTPRGTDAVLGEGFFGFETPSFPTFVQLLLWERFGLLIPSPVLVIAVIALVELFRRGYRAETAVVASVLVLFPLYVASFYAPGGVGTAGGDVGPGPRYLIPMLPFLAVPLAVAYRAWPGATAALAFVSFVLLAAPTLTRPQAGWDGHVFDRLVSPGFEGYSPTIADLVGITGPTRVLPVFLVLAVAVCLAAWSARPRAPRHELAAAGAALVAWGAASWSIAIVLRPGEFSDSTAAVLALLVAGASVMCFAAFRRLAGTG